MLKKELAQKEIKTSQIKESKRGKFVLNLLSYIGISILFTGVGFLANSLYWKYYVLKNKEKAREIQATIEETLKEDEEVEYTVLGETGPILSPLNGIEISEEKYEQISKNIPHAVMISNNKSARSEQYGLSYADVVYEAEVEGGITRFMGIYWSNQEDYILKPIRSVRKYFFDWALEYGNIPVSFTGFAKTDNPNTNAWGLYLEEDIRVTYFDWPFLWDDECIAIHPRMHCKRTTPELLYKVFDEHEWTFESWERLSETWTFDESINTNDYEKATEISYDFGYNVDWSSRWVYNQETGLYEKYDPFEKHIDMNNNEVISASTLIVQKVKRTYTGDAEGRVAYDTIGQGDAIIFRDSILIESTWEKPCQDCKTSFHVKLPSMNIESPLKPGLIWVAVVPDDKEVKWME